MKKWSRLAQIAGILCLPALTWAQADRWQQRAEYQMEIDFDVDKDQFKGTQRLVYYNNSPDTLTRVFYHLYFNAFQPGSAMDVRSRNLPDPDGRVGARISKLKPNEIGYLKINKLTQDGKELKHLTEGTILEVTLDKPILPKSKVVFDMNFDGQVPIQIRRSGRDNAEGVDYSMAQWYPKMAEYDYQGWHANPYIAREFYGIWGDFDVKISIDKNYVIGGTGYLQNPEEIGHGYLPEGQTPKPAKGAKLTWHFKAPNVHDFVWAADPNYTHTSLKRPDGLTLNFFYLKTERNQDNWAGSAQSDGQSLHLHQPPLRAVSLPAVFLHPRRRWGHGIPNGDLDYRQSVDAEFGRGVGTRVDAQLVPDDSGFQREFVRLDGRRFYRFCYPGH